MTVTDWEVFRGGRRPGPLAPTVTITARGQISFSRRAFAALGSPEAVEVLIATDKRRVGFRAAAPEPPALTFWNIGKTGHNKVIAGAALCRHLGLELGLARRYVLTDDDGVQSIDLTAGDAVYGAGSKKHEPKGEQQ